MNDKFFDLKKEKQDRMINAGLHIFAMNGYRHASTDEIVKEANISKGLLFHYFESKAGYYSFLYDYATRYAILELTSQIRDSKVDYFSLHRQILRVEEDLLGQYPYLYLFLQSCELEDDPEGLAHLSTPEKTVKDYCISLLSDADLSSYIRLTGREEISELIREVKLQEMRELFPTGHPVSDYTTKMTHTIDLLQRLSSAL
ncbi:MAG TPA: TetR family transcriptional regulator [Lachnospiraceae bacterium]|jgi:TetR/AcrR family transcriptional regulator|nr:TetR family transcriptional regulator [Lachnospiraceae bacterium]